MSPPTEIEQEIIELTISKEDKKALENTASSRGLNLNEYLLEIVLNAVAERQAREPNVVRGAMAELLPPFKPPVPAPPAEPMAEPEPILLSERDWDTVMSAVSLPPELNWRLRAAIKKYKEQYKRS